MLFFPALLTCFMLAVIWFDITRFIIPNWLVGILLALYPVMLVMTPLPVDWAAGLLVMGITFLVGLIIFRFRFMGGGDVKLMIVCALWAGTSAALEFFVYMGLLGGALSLFIYLVRPFYAFALSKMQNPHPIPRLLTVGEPVPYGVAIATAFLIILWMGKVPGLPVT